ncbi:MAG TPA: FAD-binding oxidoreductase [Chitinophagaceae bacterium]|nr:FAD-binding oxidoreductase [Chitinophagaceae bacterium]
MNIDYLIIGQGISGTWLSYYLQKEGKSFFVIDNNSGNSSSKVTAGVVNPVTGRRHVSVWMADELLPFVWNAYNELGNHLGIKAISQKKIVDFFPSAQMRMSFQQRADEGAGYVSMPEDENRFRQDFNYEMGFGEISPVYTAHPENILPAWRQLLVQKKLLIEEDFDLPALQVKKDGVQYGSITASKIIFCDGHHSACNPYFKQLPFAPNKGEALIAEIPGLPSDLIYKKTNVLVPLATPGLWWVGASYEWDYQTEGPTKEFRDRTEQSLKEWLKIPFKITGHLSGLRPATLERRPFVGFHPLQPTIGILNGMGAKGCSLAPYFAQQLVNHLIHQRPIAGEADVKRFSGILSR